MAMAVDGASGNSGQRPSERCEVPENWPEFGEQQPLSLGIDEAGRGPVLGPLVYAVFVSPTDSDALLRQLGVDDSKKTTEEQRNEIFNTIVSRRNEFGWKIHSLGPQELSAKMLRRQKYNLNEISHDTAISLIRSCLEKGYNVQKVFIDTVGKSDVYQKKLTKLFPQLEITVAEKADSLFATVGAASILAKVTRDHELCNWKYDEMIPSLSRRFGSGYPGDEVTKEYLEDVFDPLFGFPSIARFSWGTVKLLLEKHGFQVDWYEDENNSGPQSAHLLSFFPKKSSKSNAIPEQNSFCLRNRIESLASWE